MAWVHILFYSLSILSSVLRQFLPYSDDDDDDELDPRSTDQARMIGMMVKLLMYTCILKFALCNHMLCTFVA